MEFPDIVTRMLPLAGVLVAVAVGLYAAQRILNRVTTRSGFGFRNQIIMLGLTTIGAILTVSALPVGETLRGQLLGLLGIVLSAAIALSSTTLLGNVLAGLMLRAVRSFRMGDFIRVENHFGRVSERGLFHTEIQTENRDLTTLPNLFLVSHPVTTVRTSGTIVSATLSLGYDIARSRVEKALLDAAGELGLENPFVRVERLGDFSVTYRIAGLLAEVKQLLSAQSRLRECMMDKLHAQGIEIVSPTFMNTRAVAPGKVFVSRPDLSGEGTGASAPGVERIVFDKADGAESLEALRQREASLGVEVTAAGELLKSAAPDDRERLEEELRRLEVRRDALRAVIERQEKKLAGE